MTLAELKTLALDLLGEKGNYWPDAQLTRQANFANRTVYRAVANRDPSHFASYKRFTYPAETRAVALTGATALNISNEPYRILDVAVLSENTDPTVANAATSLENLHPEEAYTTSSTNQDPYYYNYGQTHSMRWVLDHSDLSIIPMPATEVFLWVRYVSIPKSLTLAADELLTPDGLSGTHAFEFTRPFE